MAPRRTSKRMNAAIKGLQPFGFHRNTILKTVNRLLKAYGGDHGWTFIEEDSYKLVIETILADQEEKEAAEKKEENAEVKMEDSTACSQNANDVNGDTNFAEGSINLNDIPIYRSGASEPTIPLIRKRPPCYGWISESEDESDEPPCQC